MKTGFFAYSGQPQSVRDSIQEAIKQINDSGVTHLTSWETYSINGKEIIDEVKKQIDQTDYFCADLTGFSDNVLFELGYAIAKQKSIFLILDISHRESVNRYKELSSLTTIGYQKYTNSSEIINAFHSFVNNDHQKTQPSRQYSSISNNPLLFLKNQYNTDYSRAIMQKIEEFKIPFTIDDPSESKIQPLDWYLEQLNMAKAALIEFCSTDRRGYEIHNLKCSFVAGLAVGYDLDIVMIAQEPYDVPIDYRNLLIKYQDKQRCQQIVSEFLTPLKDTLFDYYTKVNLSREIKKNQTEFQKISFGEFLAEHESAKLFEYYVEIFQMSNLTKNEYNIVIGRKGTGKTATLYYLKSLVESDIRNHVCLIKPVNFEIDALIKILQIPSEEYEKAYLIESTWKLLIYTEIAKSIYDKVDLKPLYAISEKEQEFTNFVQDNSDIFLKDFAERTEEELEKIISENKLDNLDNKKFKIKVAEIMHDDTLLKIRSLLAELFEKGKKIVVLIDNLDKSWKKGHSLNLQSRWILGLLSVTGRIAKELSSFRIKNNQKKVEIDFNLTIFLRSDIFQYIIKNAREPDKIEYTNLLRLGDKSILYRIIEERFTKLSIDQPLADTLWQKYIVETIDNIPIKDYIYDKLIPRPRDIIYFFRNAHETAISRGHSKIEEDDVKKAYENYSSWVFTSIIVENGVSLDQIAEFLYALVGSSQIVDQETLYMTVCDLGLPDSNEFLDNLIERLTTLSIIGKEVANNQFEFEYTFDNKDKINVKAKRLNSNRYKIHNALVPFLELTPSEK